VANIPSKLSSICYPKHKHQRTRLNVQIPLNIAIRETSDAGAPISASDPSSSSAQAYHRIAARIKEKLFDPAQQSQQAPSIVN